MTNSPPIRKDWPDHDAVKILKSLTAVAKPATRLTLIDSVAGVLYPDPTTDSASMPFPLLPFNDFVHKLDMVSESIFRGNNLSADRNSSQQMLSCLTAMERTTTQFIQLGDQAGWALEEFHASPIGFSQLVFKLA